MFWQRNATYGLFLVVGGGGGDVCSGVSSVCFIWGARLE
jgi:hypothetical protein